MSVSAHPGTNRVTLEVTKTSRLIFTFNPIGLKQYSQFAALSAVINDPEGDKNISDYDHSAALLIKCCDELLIDFSAETLKGKKWVKASATDKDGKAISTKQKGWKDKIYSLYKIAATQWVMDTMNGENIKVKNS